MASEPGVRQLLDEVLAGEADNSRGDVATHHKLIFVTVKAGLPQYPVDSLRAINVTLRRCPVVLFTSLDQDENRTGSPVFLWLIPSILSLLARTTSPEVIAQCSISLHLVFSLEKKVHVRGFKPRVVWRYLQGCLRDVTLRIKTSPTKPPTQWEKLRLPSERMIALVCPHFEGLFREPSSLFTAVLSKRSAVELVAERLEQVLLSFDKKLLTLRQNEVASPDDSRPYHSNGEQSKETEGSTASYRLFSLFESSREDILKQVCVVASETWPELDEDDCTKLFRCLGRYACVAAAQISSLPSLDAYVCPACDLKGGEMLPAEAAILDELTKIFISLTKLHRTRFSKKLRTAAVECIPRLIQHRALASGLTGTYLGEYCLKAVSSSTREVRIAAGRVLCSFVDGSDAARAVPSNRDRAFEWLRSILGKSNSSLQETTILALGQLSRNVEGVEENFAVLPLLVEFLGHPNQLLNALAFDELQMLTNHSPFTALKIFAPYWRTIGMIVVLNLEKRPQMVQQMSELLSMNIGRFLVLLQSHIVPSLVIRRETGHLESIARACGLSVMALCRSQNNMAGILAAILLETTGNIDNAISSILRSATPDFDGMDSSEVLCSEPQATVTELLKSLSANDDNKRVMAQRGIQHLANITHGKFSSSRNTRSIDCLGPFFQTHVLGILAILADTINDGKGPQPLVEKRQCLRAIRDMLRIATTHVSSGLPQICACLRTAIEQMNLVNEGFDAWITMVSCVSKDDLSSVMEPTLVLLLDYWNVMSNEMQQRAHDMLQLVFQSHQSVIRDVGDRLPSLSSIPLLRKFEGDIATLKNQRDTKFRFNGFCERLQSENALVILKALEELASFLEVEQSFIHNNANSEQPDPIVSNLSRSLLDVAVLFSNYDGDIARLCARCLGYIGCLDPTRIESVRVKNDLLVLQNFNRNEETRDFILTLLQDVLVKAFLSATNSKNQGFLAFAMQELLVIGDFESSVRPRSRGEDSFDDTYVRWHNMPESVRTLLTPFLGSRYFVTGGSATPQQQYPIFTREMGHAQWLRTFTFDLLSKDLGSEAFRRIAQVLSRVIRSQDISISSFLIPFAVLNAILCGSDEDRANITSELERVLAMPLSEHTKSNDAKLSSQTVFETLDYLSRWVQGKRKELAFCRAPGTRSTGRTFSSSEVDIERHAAYISSLEYVLASIPAEVIAQRAVECRSFARALFHWEQFIRLQRSRDDAYDMEPYYQRLQHIYTEIDEPDGIEGISSFIHVLDVDQQILEHRKAGRWDAAQSWYELRLAEKPNDSNVQRELLTCLKGSGQYDMLLNQVDKLRTQGPSKPFMESLATEACWMTAKYSRLNQYVDAKAPTSIDFNIGIGQILEALTAGDKVNFQLRLKDMQSTASRGLSATNVTSLQECRDTMLRLHVLAEIEMIDKSVDQETKNNIVRLLSQRLDIIGPFWSDKQYILGIRRAVMHLSSKERHDSSGKFTNLDIASSWLQSAQLARKANLSRRAFHAVLQAAELGDAASKIEHARLLWKENNHRKAIQSLEGAIAANAFISYTTTAEKASSMVTTASVRYGEQNPRKALAQLLLAKWMDRASQTQSSDIVLHYRSAVASFSRWERSHFHLGKHYNKLLESEKAKPHGKQAQTYLCGETAKLVIENYLRALSCGTKYVYQALPRIITLWLSSSTDAEGQVDSKQGNDDAFRAHIRGQRQKILKVVNAQIRKYLDRLPAWLFYTALPQLVARICHNNRQTTDLLIDIVAKVVHKHTPQALWTLLAMVKSSTKERANRGMSCMTKTLDMARGADRQTIAELNEAMVSGQKLSDQLLHVCEGTLHTKETNVSLSKDLRFNHKAAASKLAVPVEASLTASLPTSSTAAGPRNHQAFSNEYVKIVAFMDDVLVLNSLQRPRKITLRGSDGHQYSLLCKPKDDLRKDQRLMEFNAVINRSLKKDAESSKRRLYVKTYAVTPLNEECGLIEWIDGLRTLRDILMGNYKQKNIVINYTEIRNLMTDAISHPDKLPLFRHKVLKHFPPVFSEWFIEMFPEPGAWFAARLRYTRSCAVMSIIGHVLGLGDRHGENILFEEGNGGTFHVDFNCLFDKGLTFEKPELVPFRLTHNMVDAFGAYEYQGPYRKSAELTMLICRQNEDTLMTILETFLYDPTTDFIGKKKKRDQVVPDTPEGVLDNVRMKVKGLLPQESVPLSVEGYVDELIRQATDPFRLASMYIGWCPFF